MGHPKLKPPVDDDEMDEYMLALREKVGTGTPRLRGVGLVCPHVRTRTERCKG